MPALKKTVLDFPRKPQTRAKTVIDCVSGTLTALLTHCLHMPLTRRLQKVPVLFRTFWDMSEKRWPLTGLPVSFSFFAKLAVFSVENLSSTCS